MAIKSCWASSSSNATLIRDSDDDGRDDDDGTLDFDITGQTGLFEIISFYNNFCPAFDWVKPDLTELVGTGPDHLNPVEEEHNHAVTLRQFMFNGLSTMYYHCDVS